MSRRDDLIDEQNRTWTRMQELMQRADSEGRDLSADEARNWDEANARLDQIDGELRRLDTMNARERVDRSQVISGAGQPAAEPNDPDGANRSAEQTAEDYRAAFETYMRRGAGRLTERQRNLLEANHQELDQRAQGESAPAAGGYLVPPEFQQRIATALESYGGMLQFCNRITTENGANLSWPTSDDRGNEGMILAENTQVGEQDALLGQRQIGAYTYTSKMIRVSWQLLNDTAFDLEGFLSRIMGERLGRIYARHLIAGTGTGQPTGVLSGLRVGATSPAGATQSLTYDNLIDLEHSIDPAYRNGGNCRYGMGDQTLKIVRKIKDADGRPLWQPIPAPGFGPTINGVPYFIDNSMSDPVAGGVGIIFGDFFAGMLVREVQGFSSVALRERFADFLQTAFFAYSRMDAKPDDPRALAALKFGAAS